MMDTVGNKVAASEIAQIKVIVPNIVCDVIDRAIQMHGGRGVSSFPTSENVCRNENIATSRWAG